MSRALSAALTQRYRQMGPAEHEAHEARCRRFVFWLRLDLPRVRASLDLCDA